MKNWIGKWVMFVAIGHTVVASIFFGGTYRELVTSGIYNSIKSEKGALAVWFVLFGILLFIVGMLISAIEKHGSQVSKAVGVALFMLTIIGVLLMPISGFWLMFPAIFAIFYGHRPILSKAKT